MKGDCDTKNNPAIIIILTWNLNFEQILFKNYFFSLWPHNIDFVLLCFNLKPKLLSFTFLSVFANAGEWTTLHTF